MTNRDLAAMLDLFDPGGAEARRVAKVFRDLAALKLIKRTGDPGRVSETLVLNPNGDGEAWSDLKLESAST